VWTDVRPNPFDPIDPGDWTGVSAQARRYLLLTGGRVVRLEVRIRGR